MLLLLLMHMMMMMMVIPAAGAHVDRRRNGFSHGDDARPLESVGKVDVAKGSLQCVDAADAAVDVGVTLWTGRVRIGCRHN